MSDHVEVFGQLLRDASASEKPLTELAIVLRRGERAGLSINDGLDLVGAVLVLALEALAAKHEATQPVPERKPLHVPPAGMDEVTFNLGGHGDAFTVSWDEYVARGLNYMGPGSMTMDEWYDSRRTTG